jgi:phage gp36-like protein
VGYATLEDVQARMPQFTLNATSKPTADVAQTFLDDKEAEVDSALENLGYYTPITGKKSLLQVKAVICQGAIAQILYARAAAVGGEASFVSADRAQKIYDETLKAWADTKSPKELSDARRTADEVIKSEQTLGGLTRDEDGDPIEPTVTMDKNW